MQAQELLLCRQSCPRLVSPAPTDEALQLILNAAVRVPDHGNLTPWEFIIVKDDGLSRLGDIFSQALIETNAEQVKIEKSKNLPLRAPMIIIGVAKCTQHAKVPVLEQQISAGCSMMAMQQAAFSLGYGGIWRTGELAFNKHVHQSLNLNELDQIVGFLYLGTPAIDVPTKPLRTSADFVRYL